MSEHTAYIGTYPDARKFAFCRCGWKAPSRKTTIEACHDRDAHIAAAPRQPAQDGADDGGVQ